MVDIVDWAQKREEEHRADALRDRLRTAQLNARRASSGGCEDCGCDIPKARLAALPSATRCTDCQERHERDRGIGL